MTKYEEEKISHKDLDIFGNDCDEPRPGLFFEVFPSVWQVNWLQNFVQIKPNCISDIKNYCCSWPVCTSSTCPPPLSLIFITPPLPPPFLQWLWNLLQLSLIKRDGGMRNMEMVEVTGEETSLPSVLPRAHFFLSWIPLIPSFSLNTFGTFSSSLSHMNDKGQLSLQHVSCNPVTWPNIKILRRYLTLLLHYHGCCTSSSYDILNKCKTS